MSAQPRGFDAVTDDCIDRMIAGDSLSDVLRAHSRYGPELLSLLQAAQIVLHAPATPRGAPDRAHALDVTLQTVRATQLRRAAPHAADGEARAATVASPSRDGHRELSGPQSELPDPAAPAPPFSKRRNTPRVARVIPAAVRAPSEDNQAEPIDLPATAPARAVDDEDAQAPTSAIAASAAPATPRGISLGLDIEEAPRDAAAGLDSAPAPSRTLSARVRDWLGQIPDQHAYRAVALTVAIVIGAGAGLATGALAANRAPAEWGLFATDFAPRAKVEGTLHSASNEAIIVAGDRGVFTVLLTPETELRTHAGGAIAATDLAPGQRLQVLVAFGDGDTLIADKIRRVDETS